MIFRSTVFFYSVNVLLWSNCGFVQHEAGQPHRIGFSHSAWVFLVVRVLLLHETSFVSRSAALPFLLFYTGCGLRTLLCKIASVE